MGLVALVKDETGGWSPGERKPAFGAVKRTIAETVAAAGPADCHLNAYNRLSSPAGMVVSYGYCLVLERPVDGQGFAARKAALERDVERDASAGERIVDMLMSLLQSEEFATRQGVSGLDDAAYVRLLYRLLLGREPDGAGLASYTSALAAGAMRREDLQRSIIGSSELRTRHPVLFPTASLAAN
jgi:hypothetical protein